MKEIRLDLIAVFATLSLITGLAGASGDPGRYRLAGIMSVGEDFLALIEVGEQEQVLLRQGSEIGSGRVVLLDRERVRIEFPDRVLELSLEGAGEARVLPAALGVVTESSDSPGALVREVDTERLRESLDASGTEDRAATSGRPARRPAAGTQLAVRLAPVLNLPPDARIVAVNEQPVRSVDEALALIDGELANGTVARLNLAAAPGEEAETRVYLTARREATEP
jgi:hypothetical protein